MAALTASPSPMVRVMGFSPDVLASLGGGDRDQPVPVRRRRDVDDVNILPGQDFAEILVRFDVLARDLERGLQVVLIHVADREQL
jgi:hypothetical protein